MNAIMDEKAEEPVAKEESAPQEMQLPADDVVRDKWAALAGEYSAKPRLASMMTSGTVSIEERDGVKVLVFSVLNEAQKQWMEEKMLRELETRLRSLAACPKINIEVTVIPAEEIEKKPYMPEEKAKDLIEKNPDVRAFVADLGLDTK